jgi:hypothetical protein
MVTCTAKSEWRGRRCFRWPRRPPPLPPGALDTVDARGPGGAPLTLAVDIVRFVAVGGLIEGPAPAPGVVGRPLAIGIDVDDEEITVGILADKSNQQVQGLVLGMQ